MTELELVARRAHLAMLHDVRPMPADVALDCVQDVAGERSEALAALLREIADRLRSEIPEEGSVCRCLADWVSLDIRVRNFATPVDHIKEIRSRSAVGTDLGAAWLRWCGYADRAIDIARRLTEAATAVV